MSELRLVDCTGEAKILVRSDPDGALAAALDVPYGRAARDGDGALVARTSPDAWMVLAPAGTATGIIRRLEAPGDGDFASVVDVTHGYALFRLTGVSAVSVLAQLCAIDLADAATRDGTAFRSLVAGITATVIRDDERAVPSYLVQCDRSYGQYLVDVLTDAGEHASLGLVHREAGRHLDEGGEL